MKILIVGFLAAFFGSSVMAASKFECTANGKSLSQNGRGSLTAIAKLTFTDGQDASGNRVLTEIEGKVQTTPEETNELGSYIGVFKIASVTENPNYRPQRYVGYSQFEKFDATETPHESAEEGMWGYLLVEKKTTGKFRAEYIFQAGDHMGGTLHMSCRKI